MAVLTGQASPAVALRDPTVGLIVQRATGLPAFLAAVSAGAVVQNAVGFRPGKTSTVPAIPKATTFPSVP